MYLGGAPKAIASCSRLRRRLDSGRDRSGAYYSPLTNINEHNVGQLGFAWEYDLATYRGQEASPIVVDGVMYTSGTWGYVYALNAATGQELWKFDPKVHGQAGRYPCCDLLNRGVAVWEGRRKERPLLAAHGQRRVRARSTLPLSRHLAQAV